MRLGFSLPQYGPIARQGADIGRFAGTAERLGASGLWVGDRLLAPKHPTVGYGGTDTLPPEFDDVLDPFAVLAVAAGATRTVRLGASVLVAPWYPPAVLARQLTTLDVVSGGRLLPGFGIGWSPEEYRAAGIPWARRGSRLEEGLDALLDLWTGEPAEHVGEHWTVPAARVATPVQEPRPPVYLAGHSEVALRRIGRRGDGWLPAVVVPGRADPQRLLDDRRVIDDAARAAGRDPSAIGTWLRVNVAAGTDVATIAATAAAVADATGIEDLFVDLAYVASDVDEQLHLVEQLLAA